MCERLKRRILFKREYLFISYLSLEPYIVHAVATSKFYYHAYDSQGTARLLTNPAGAVTDAYAYRAFGAAWQGGNGSANAYRYAGEYGYYRDSAAVEYVRAI